MWDRQNERLEIGRFGDFFLATYFLFPNYLVTMYV